MAKVKNSFCGIDRVVASEREVELKKVFTCYNGSTTEDESACTGRCTTQDEYNRLMTLEIQRQKGFHPNYSNTKLKELAEVTLGHFPKCGTRTEENVLVDLSRPNPNGPGEVAPDTNVEN